MSDQDDPSNKPPEYERHQPPVPQEPEQESEAGGMHPAIKVLLIVLIGIPALFVLLVLLVLGACFIGA